MIERMAWMSVWVAAALLLVGCGSDADSDGSAERAAESASDDAPVACPAGPFEMPVDEPAEPLTGVLEFRVAPFGPEVGAGPNCVSVDVRDEYVELLEIHGHEAAIDLAGDYIWLPLRTDQPMPQLVTAAHDGRRFLLLDNRPDHVMGYNPSDLGWRVERVSEGEDAAGHPAVDFRLDEWGASQMATLTAAHLGDALAIILDGDVYAAPIVHGVVGGRGQITTDDPDDVARILDTLRAGASAATER